MNVLAAFRRNSWVDRAVVMLGVIGISSPAFVIGSRTDQIRASGAGRLYLGVNDDYSQDNSGEYRVTVSVRR